MKLHEVEPVETRKATGEWTSWRMAVPGGWKYVDREPASHSLASCFVADPTAEHVTEAHDAVGRASVDADRAYRQGVDDCINAIAPVVIQAGGSFLVQTRMAEAAFGLCLGGRKSQTGEG